MLRRVISSFVSVVAAAALVACGGGDGGGASRPPAGTLDRVNVSQKVENLQSLSSFRFDFSMKIDAGGANDPFAAALLSGLNMQASGAFVAPDSFEATMTVLGEQVSFIQIGNRAWEKTGIRWQTARAQDLGFDQSFEGVLGDVLPAEILKAAKVSREKMNGYDTVRYSFDKKALSRLLAEIDGSGDLGKVDNATLNVWVLDDVVPVKLTMVIAGKDEKGDKFSISLDFNVTDIDSPDIKIKPPL